MKQFTLKSLMLLLLLLIGGVVMLGERHGLGVHQYLI